MNLEYDIKPYKKIDGIYSPKLNKWEKFWVGFGRFVAEGLAGKWKVEFKIKF